MKKWNKLAYKQMSFSDLEVLLGILFGVLVINLVGIVPGYMKQVRSLKQESQVQKDRIQVLRDYKAKEEVWREWGVFLDLQQEGYTLDFPKLSDEQLLVGQLEDYLKTYPVTSVAIDFQTMEELPPFKKYVYQVTYVSSDQVAKEVLHELGQVISGMRVEKMKMNRLDIEVVETQLTCQIWCQ